MKYKVPYSLFSEILNNDFFDYTSIKPCNIPEFEPYVVFTQAGYESTWDIEAQRPVYSIRGQSISKETAYEIIRKNDNYLLKTWFDSRESNPIGKLFKKVGVYPGDYVRDYMFMNNWFPHPFELACGWCHPDGYIGTTDYSSVEDPLSRDMFDLWNMLITEVIKELNLVVVVLTANVRLDTSKTFEEQIAFGILVQGTKIEILEREEAISKFQEYDQLYGDHTLVRPLRDPAILKLESFVEDDYYLEGLDRGEWIKCSCSYNHSLDLSNQARFARIPAINGKVDKNNVMYYGVPDYSYQKGPMTFKDLELFAQKFKEEEELKQKED